MLVEARLEAVHLDDQHRGGIQRKTEPEGLLDRLDNEVVHHLQSRGYNALLDDAGNGAGCVVDAVEHGQKRAATFGLPHQARHDLGDDAQRPLRARNEPHEIIAGQVLDLPAQLHHLPVGQHQLDPEDMVDRDAVLERVGPPALVPTLPPMVQAAWLDGSGAYKYPRGAASRLIHALTTPGSTTARRLRKSM